MVNIETIKDIFSRYVERVKQLQGIIAIALMTMTFSAVAVPYFERWGVHPYIAFPVTVTLVFIFIITFAYVYIDVFKMNRFMFKANADLNPYANDRLSRLNKLMNVLINIPILENHGLYEEANILRKWCKMNDDIPSELKHLFEEVIGSNESISNK